MSMEDLTLKTGVALMDMAISPFESPEFLAPSGKFDKKRQELRAEYLQVVAFGQKIKVVDEVSLLEATQAGRVLQAATKRFEEFYKPIKQSYDAAKKGILEMERADLAEINTVKESLAAQTLAYQDQQEKLRQEAERAARAAVAAAGEERRLQEAITLEAQGLTEEAEARLEEPILAAPVIVQTSMPKKPAGSVRRESWKACVDDFGKLVAAVATGKVSLLALQANQGWLDKQASAYREGLAYPGVSVTCEVKGHFRS